VNKTFKIATAVACLAVGSNASAATILYDGSVPTATTNWDVMIDVPQFDDMGGTRVLKTISIFLEGTVSGTASGESLDAAPAVVELFLQSEISLSLGGSDLAVVIPVANASFNATAWDGTTDFGGTSGASFANLNASDSTKGLLIQGNDDLTPWIGGGTVTLDGAAIGQSSGSGAGNLILQFATDASLVWSVEYEYNIIPAPGAVALFGLAGVGAIRRRR